MVFWVLVEPLGISWAVASPIWVASLFVLARALGLEIPHSDKTFVREMLSPWVVSWLAWGILMTWSTGKWWYVTFSWTAYPLACWLRTRPSRRHAATE